MGNIRLASIYDAGQIKEIYNPYINKTTISYEMIPVSTQEFEKRIEHTLKDFPWLVYEEDGKILGYAYAGRFKERAAFDWDVEVSVYVCEKNKKNGIGSKLFEKLLDILTNQGYINVYSLIDYPNDASVHLHEKFGFKKEFVYEKVAFKQDAWRDLLIMQKRLKTEVVKPEAIKDYRLFLT